MTHTSTRYFSLFFLFAHTYKLLVKTHSIVVYSIVIIITCRWSKKTTVLSIGTIIYLCMAVCPPIVLLYIRKQLEACIQTPGIFLISQFTRTYKLLVKNHFNVVSSIIIIFTCRWSKKTTVLSISTIIYSHISIGHPIILIYIRMHL